MSSSLSQLRLELAARLGFGAMGADSLQKPLLDSLLQSAQDEILAEFGSMVPGTVTPPAPFVADADMPSVPEGMLLTKALVKGKAHFKQDTGAAVDAWNQYEGGVRGVAR